MRRWKPLLVPCFVALLALAKAAAGPGLGIDPAGPGLGIDLRALAVPEPSTLLVVSLELAGLAVRRRRTGDRGAR